MGTRRKLTAVPDKVPPAPPPDLREAVQQAIDAMPWLADSDRALAALALRHAAEIETVVERARLFEDIEADLDYRDRGRVERLRKLEAMCDVTKTVGWLGPQLQGLLRDLGGAPAARAAMKGDKPVGGRLAELRNQAAKPPKR